MENKHLHVAVASDSNYARMVSVLLTSLFDNNPEFDDITVHFLTNHITPQALADIQQHVPENRGEIVVHDVSSIRQMLGVDVPPTISISSYSRLFLSSLLDKNIERVLYMDVDALITGSLWTLWNMDMCGYEVAGVLDDVSLHAKRAVGMSDDDPYINAGFLLMNLALWRKEGTEKKILDFLLARHGNVFHHDQGLINAVCKKKLILPINYNMVTNFFAFPYNNFHQVPFYTENEMEEGKQDPIFIHFTAGVAGRPWMRGCKHPLRQKYWDAMDKAGFDSRNLPPDNRPVRLKALAILYYYLRPIYYVVLKLRGAIKE